MMDKLSDSLYSLFHDVTVLANLASFCVKLCKQILKVFLESGVSEILPVTKLEGANCSFVSFHSGYPYETC